MSYTDIVDWMFNLERFGIKLGLDNMKEFLSRIGNPHAGFPCVHVTGTNGKGSVCTYLTDIMTEHGLKVGLYTSPHLVDFRERIRIGDEEIPEEDVVRIGNNLRAVMESMSSEGPEKQLTFFEFTTGLAFEYFREMNVDFVIAEVGMGGRLDATNVLQPEVAVITRVGMEHTDYLGKTVEDIAREKAGIIKPGADVVTCERNPDVISIISSVCEKHGCRLLRIDDDFAVSNIRQTLEGTSFDYSGGASISDVRTGLLGAFQAENAGIAIAVIERLRQRDIQVSDKEILRGIARSRWPGRLEIVSKDPLVVLDGGHNPEGIRTTVAVLRSLGLSPMTYVLGCMKDKDAREIVRQLKLDAAMLVITEVKNKRALPSLELEEIAKEEFDGPIVAVPDSGEAIDMALEHAEGRGICVTGSLYLVGEAIQWLRAHGLSSVRSAQHINGPSVLRRTAKRP